MTKEEKGFILALGGIALLVASKIISNDVNNDLNKSINGESLYTLKQLNRTEINERLKLAVKEERFNDAAELKEILERKKFIHIS